MFLYFFWTRGTGSTGSTCQRSDDCMSSQTLQFASLVFFFPSNLFLPCFLPFFLTDTNPYKFQSKKGNEEVRSRGAQDHIFFLKGGRSFGRNEMTTKTEAQTLKAGLKKTPDTWSRAVSTCHGECFGLHIWGFLTSCRRRTRRWPLSYPVFKSCVPPWPSTQFCSIKLSVLPINFRRLMVSGCPSISSPMFPGDRRCLSLSPFHLPVVVDDSTAAAFSICISLRSPILLCVPDVRRVVQHHNHLWNSLRANSILNNLLRSNS